MFCPTAGRAKNTSKSEYVSAIHHGVKCALQNELTVGGLARADGDFGLESMFIIYGGAARGEELADEPEVHHVGLRITGITEAIAIGVHLVGIGGIDTIIGGIGRRRHRHRGVIISGMAAASGKASASGCTGAASGTRASMAGPVSGLRVASIQVLVSGSQTRPVRHSVSSAQVNVDGPVDSPQPMRMSAVMIKNRPTLAPHTKCIPHHG